jgi:hypothetical protein
MTSWEYLILELREAVGLISLVESRTAVLLKRPRE